MARGAFRERSMLTLPDFPLPDARGRFGPYGGRYVPETLIPALEELEAAYREAKKDPAFLEELDHYLRQFAGRPTPLYHAKRLSEYWGGAQVFLKREDLLHTGAHKINNTLGQALLARRMGKRRVIAETGAGQHGVSVATVAALFGLECVVYMGEEDVRRQALNVFRMKLLGAEVRPVAAGSRTLKDATNEAIRDWITNVRTTFYILGSVVGPHPYPMMVRDFQSVIGEEVKRQSLELFGRLPDALIAAVGGGSNAIGLFAPFAYLPEGRPKLIGVEAAGEGLSTGRHAASIGAGKRGCCTGATCTSSTTTMGRSPRPTPSPQGWTTPGWGRSTATTPTPGWRSTPASRTRRPSRASSSWRGLRASSPPWSRPTPSPTPPRWCRRWTRTRWWSSTSPAGGTRT